MGGTVTDVTTQQLQLHNTSQHSETHHNTAHSSDIHNTTQQWGGQSQMSQHKTAQIHFPKQYIKTGKHQNNHTNTALTEEHSSTQISCLSLYILCKVR